MRYRKMYFRRLPLKIYKMGEASEWTIHSFRADVDYEEEKVVMIISRCCNNPAHQSLQLRLRKHGQTQYLKNDEFVDVLRYIFI